MYKVVLSDKFKSQFRKLSKSNKALHTQIRKTVEFLYVDIKHPSLRLHKLENESYWSISVNKSIRIVMRWNEDSLYLLRVGKHEDVY